ncbi:type II secretion system F family protein [Rhizobium sp. YJ-22]|mgnify:CR=1 FL=1|uniref:type II secretion system F family protein n=1 Tax=Rhizobium sp. YJ-22 TaxID=3037556 RepID=UPI0024129280|nr:type II secretion system F family protein [Rhizobium sp. YJ-22]MDG3575430.1 type II secretion system F family protein [Rhizobium sp. YJ-22]
MNLIVILIVVLVAVAAGGIAYGLLFSSIETQKKVEGRVNRVVTAENDRGKAKAARERVQDAAKRRKSMQDSIKEMEKRSEQKNRSLSIREKLAQTGLPLTMKHFYIGSTGLGIVTFAIAFLLSGSLPIAAGLAFAASMGLPRWVVAYLISRRKKKFLEEFPNSLDVMVRSIRSGLPLNDAMRMIASDGQEPVRSEFLRVVEAQQMGFSIPEACSRMTQTMPLQELSFFAIVIAIQSQAGGNLSEALGNLARVLRERKKMKAKVAALSMEAKASAAIIGALPFIVALLVYITSPHYIMILFTDPRGHLILGISGIWMSIGIFVMKNMVSFDI